MKNSKCETHNWSITNVRFS